MVPGDLPDRDPPRVWACAAQSHRLVPSASCPGPDGDPPAHPRAGARPAAVRLFADLGPVTAGGLAGESETGAPVVPPRVQLRMRVRRRKHIALHRGTRSGMKRSKFSEEQVAYALRQAEAGTAVGDVCRQLGISEATFYVWKKRFGHLGVNEVRRVRQLEDENARLKRLVADLTLDKHMLAEALRRTS